MGPTAFLPRVISKELPEIIKQGFSEVDDDSRRKNSKRIVMMLHVDLFKVVCGFVRTVVHGTKGKYLFNAIGQAY